MTDGETSLVVRRCTECHGHFLPRVGPCPHCGSTSTESETIDAVGTVLAMTEVTVPPPGWESPHRLALVELAHQVRLLALVSGPAPANGDRVQITSDGARFTVRADR